MKRLSVLGSTGSIGTQTLDVVRNHPDRFEVTVLAAAGHKKELLLKQIEEFKPKLVAVFDDKAALELKSEIPVGTELVSGREGLLAAASADCVDTVVTALVGMSGLEPTAEAIKAHKQIALANKETLVCGGALITKMARENGVEIVPVDSEHCAIFQCLLGVKKEHLKRILLTASGGPFRGKNREELKNVTLEDALKHPNWNMGPKVTLDSATLMNKALEMIEARWLFDTTAITPIIQPTSIVHSLIELQDGTVLGQFGVPDMRLPIEVALTYPDRGKLMTKPLDLLTCGPIVFEEIKDPFTVPLNLASFALEKGGLYPAVFELAGEVAVKRFMNREIGFLDIYDTVEKAVNYYDKSANPGTDYTIADVMDMRVELEERIMYGGLA